MKKLFVHLNDKVAGIYDIHSTNITVGRKNNNTILLDSTSVSSNHAIIHVMGDDCIFEDLNSTNGSYLNNKKIKKHILQHNDLIVLGDYKIIFVSPPRLETEQSWEEDFERTMVLRNPTTIKQNQATPQPTKQEILTIIEKPMVVIEAPKPIIHQSIEVNKQSNLANIQLLNGPAAGRTMQLVKPLTTLGKPGVQAAAITKRNDGYYIIRSEGLEDIFVNQTSIGNNPFKLKDHDIIEIANVKLEFFY